jgi:DNA-binding NarL/FixJ family response regulator
MGGAMEDDQTISVVIVDDHALLREGTRQILERAGGFTLVGEADSGEPAVALVAEHHPDLVLLDLRLPGMNGVDVARQMAEVSPATRVVILSAFDDIGYVRAALAAGVAGYLLKTTPADELVGAIRAAHSGVVVLDPGLSPHVLRAPDGGPVTSGLESLTTREREVVNLVAQGLPNKEIASQLGISPRTVEGHLNHVFEKVGASSRSALVRLAMTNGLVGGP